MRTAVKSLACAVSMLIGTAHADVPRVVVDIAPIHSLAAQVMEGVGTPHLLIASEASPHGAAMKPSQARALSKADVIVWVGEPLTPWLVKPIANLAPRAAVLEVLDLDGLTRLELREGGVWGDGEHDHEHDAREDEHDDAHAHADEQGDDHDDLDAHVWLDPLNAARIAEGIADQLAKADPENAARYRDNAAATQVRLEALVAETRATLAPVKAKPFVVYHDAYQYFEARFDLSASGAFAQSDAEKPTARRLSDVRAAMLAAECVFAEPQFPQSLGTVLEGSGLRLAVLDPMGSDRTPGPDLYQGLIRDLATGIADCLTP